MRPVRLWPQIVGGILVLAGLYYTDENIKITQRSAEDAPKSATESRELTRQGQLTDRFTKADSRECGRFCQERSDDPSAT